LPKSRGGKKPSGEQRETKLGGQKRAGLTVGRKGGGRKEGKRKKG